MSDITRRTLQYDGLSFSYQLIRARSPSTEPVLAIGGVLQGMHGWSLMQQHVLPYADLVSVDLPGSGEATPLRPRQKMETMCRAVEVILDDLDVARVNFLGYSFGSAVAYRCAQNRPERIARLALGGVPVRISDRLIELWTRGAARMKAGDAEGLVDILMEMFLCPPGRAPVHNRDIVRRLVRRMTLRALTDNPHGFVTMERSVLENLDPVGGLDGVPTLVFCGEHDTISTLTEQRDFASGIEDCRFAAIAEADHWVFLERRAEASDLVMRHFTERPLTELPYALGGSATGPTAPDPSAAAVR
ncbi:alpha/beta fold hydrolase [Streptomyces alboflavus]|uniref:alpha/beta fold hydrolase n=1 Tax=Streptomyces alboflavus TaxID=67267 RepID=UPI0004C089B8|nr:alpha/beta fold hydrolase [Streptomyces alboflavus]